MLAYCVFFRAHAETQSLRNPVVVSKLSTTTISFFSLSSVKSEAEDFAIIINEHRLYTKFIDIKNEIKNTVSVGQEISHVEDGLPPFSRRGEFMHNNGLGIL